MTLRDTLNSHKAMSIHIGMDRQETICGRSRGRSKGQIEEDRVLDKGQVRYMAATATRAGTTSLWQTWINSRKCKTCETWFKRYIRFQQAGQDPMHATTYSDHAEQTGDKSGIKHLSGLEPFTDAV